MVKRTKRQAFPHMTNPSEEDFLMKNPPWVTNPTRRRGAITRPWLKIKNPSANK
jgi:hypothetical protein